MIAALLLAVPAYSQGRGDQVQRSARELADRADFAWRAMQGDLDKRDPSGVRGPRGMELYLAMSNFANSARVYADLVARYRSEVVVRGGAESLLNQADAIDALMNDTGALEHLRRDWTNARDSLLNLARPLNLRQ
jgi:hypothetical protein